MKKLILLFAACCLSAAAMAKTPATHRVVSCNIRVALPSDEASGNGWSTRKALCEQVLKRQKGDIYCLQEVFGAQYGDLQAMFPDYYAFGYDGPEMDSMPDSVYFGITKNLILFSKKRYQMTSGGTYWLSETPLIGGSKSWDTARARHVNWVRLTDRKTGRAFRVASIHLDHVSQQAREAQMKVFIDEAAQYPVDFPQILVGDFNSRPGNSALGALMTAGWRDSFVEAHGRDIQEFSCHNFRGAEYQPKKPTTPGRIDFIFLHGNGVRGVASQLIKDQIKGRFPSDHYFLTADIVID